MGTFKRIEVSYGVKRPIGRFKTESISVSLTADVEVKDETELSKEVHETFTRARELVGAEIWLSEQHRIREQHPEA
jgi:hypothetical protein